MGKGRAPCCDKIGLKKGSWTPAEDMRLMAYIRKHGHGNWRALPKKAGLLRCGKSCRLRWINYLRPDIKRGNFKKEEEDTIIKLHQLLGNKWSKIASKLPGRTDNEIKNVWNTHLKKRLIGNPEDPPPPPSSPPSSGSCSFLCEGAVGPSVEHIPDARDTNTKQDYLDDQGEEEDAGFMEKMSLLSNIPLQMWDVLEEEEHYSRYTSSDVDGRLPWGIMQPADQPQPPTTTDVDEPKPTPSSSLAPTEGTPTSTTIPPQLLEDYALDSQLLVGSSSTNGAEESAIVRTWIEYLERELMDQVEPPEMTSYEDPITSYFQSSSFSTSTSAFVL